MNELLGSNGRIGRFIIEAEVGRGGMGVVYRCTDPLHDRPVALKLLAPHLLSDTQALARFQREASLVATLRHKHIADFYEFDEQGERPYIVLEWIEGHSLKELLASQGELSLEKGLNLVQQLANALDFAHARGIIHRDLKPANIMIGQHNRAKIVDFGMALLETAPSLTTTNFIVGTPLYMSPEQILGKPLDGRSDQYSLAVIIYEMLGGQPPFSPTNTAALYHQQLNVMPPLVTHLNPQLPPAIAAVLHRALAKEPSQRFNSITEFAQALQSPTEADMTLPTPQPRRPKAILRDSEGESWVLQNESFVIGRYPPADLVLDRPRISRQHARIEYREFGYFLIDLDSRNGSFVNGRALDQTPQRLNDGDEIVLGGTVSLRFFDPEETTHGPRLGRLQGVWIDEKLHTVWVDAQLVDPPLSTAQLALLSLLYRHAGEIVSRTEIVTTVWTDIDPEGVSSEAVDGLIKRLRGRLRPYNTSQEYIEVVRGHGLRLNQPP